MDIRPKFHLRIHPLVRTQDLKNLPEDLRAGFDLAIIPALGIDPYNCEGIPSHDLDRELKGCRALEIEEKEGCYRLVYRIDESPQKMLVEIISFDIHDAAYDKAKIRLPKEKVNRWGR